MLGLARALQQHTTPRRLRTTLSAEAAYAELVDQFIERVRANLHIVLCFSPVGDKFRNRCRKFPALTSCTSINWFFNWPAQALISVANRFLADVEMETPEIRDACANHMAFVHESVGVAAETYRAQERREVYTTPKSYLELIALYKDELAINRGQLEVGATAHDVGHLGINNAFLVKSKNGLALKLKYS